MKKNVEVAKEETVVVAEAVPAPVDKRTAKLQELRLDADTLCTKWNEMFAAKKVDEYTRIEGEIREKCDEYTALVRKMCYDSCYDSADPMFTAVTRLSFVTIAMKDERVGDGSSKEFVRKIVDKTVPINLRDLHKYKPAGIGKDKNWIYMAEKFNLLLTVRVAKNLGYSDAEIKNINDSYALAEISRKMDMGETPVSNTQLLKALQSLVSAMIGEEFKASSKDVAFLVETYAKKSNKSPLTVVCANHKTFMQNVAEICHAIILKKAYGVEYKAKK